MAAVNGFSHMSGACPFDFGGISSPPLVALQVAQPLPVRQALPQTTQIAQGCAMASPLVTVGFTSDASE